MAKQFINDELVLILITNSDLQMSKGKIISQCCHAMCSVLISYDKQLVQAWRDQGEPIIVLKASYPEINKVLVEAQLNRVRVRSVCDAGRTQVPEGSYTVFAFGPAPKKILEAVTKNLKLL